MIANIVTLLLINKRNIMKKAKDLKKDACLPKSTNRIGFEV